MKRTEKRYSLAKIASELGVSKTAVSLTLNGRARENRISPDLEEKILNFCKEKNYLPNIHAQRMNSKTVKSIAVLLDEAVRIGEASPFEEDNISRIVGGIMTAADANDYRVIVQIYHPDMSSEKVFNLFRAKEIDGLIYYGLRLPEKWIDVISQENMNVVGIGIQPMAEVGSININNFHVSYQMTEAIIKQSFKKFMYLGGLVNSFVGEERFRGFRNALEDHGIEFSEKQFYRADFQEQKAYNFIKEQFLQQPDIADCIVCANDRMAIGCIHALQELGIKIPDEIAVAGGDNIKLASYLTPTLTTIDCCQQQLGKGAFQLLLDMIKGKENVNQVIKSKVFIRQST